MSWSVDDWVVCQYDRKWYPGIIQSIEHDIVTVKCMEFATFGKNSFRWPQVDDISLYSPEDILCKINPPTPVSSRFFGLRDNDFKNSNALFHLNKSKK